MPQRIASEEIEQILLSRCRTGFTSHVDQDLLLVATLLLFLVQIAVAIELELTALEIQPARVFVFVNHILRHWRLDRLLFGNELNLLFLLFIITIEYKVNSRFVAILNYHFLTWTMDINDLVSL